MKHIFFDMDGTLTDPRECFVNCVQHAVLSLGCKEQDPELLCRFIGPSLDYTFSTLFPEADDAFIAAAIRAYRERFVAKGVREIKPYPGIVEALAVLKAAGLDMYLMTIRARVNALRILDALDLAQYFRSVYGPELSATDPDKAVLMRHALTAENIRPADAVMVGDRSDDIIAARTNGLNAIAVTWGYGARADLDAARPDWLVSSVQELLACLGMVPTAL